MQDPTPLKQAGNDVTVRHLDTVALYEKAKELIEKRNEIMREWNRREDEGQGQFAIMYDMNEETIQYERLLVELGTIVGVECLQSGGK